MNELAVVSGKGGTGKTSIVASLATLTDSKVIADCDVDASDLHLILDPAVRRRAPFSGGSAAVIRADACAGCGECEDACRFGAARPTSPPADGRRYRIDPLACEGCGVCALACPSHAIDLVDVVNGEWFVSDTRHGPLVHARLGVAQENTGKLVTLVRREARRLADAAEFALVLIDGSPGIGCPVIASITGARLAVAVTEPTLSGLHDLRRVAGVAAKLRVPVAVVVNKWDLSPETARDAERWCRDEGLPIVGRVPYDEAVTAAQIEGLAVTERSNGPASRAIAGVWGRLEEMLSS